MEGSFPRQGCCSSRGRGLEHMRRGCKAHSWALTHTDAQGQTYPPLSSLFLSPGVSGFQRSLREDCLLCSLPPAPARASSNTAMPSRQLCGGSCLDHLKADGWAGIRCRPPPPRERGGSSAPLAGHWLRQMECLSQHPHMGSGGGQAPRQQGGSSGQPSGRALSKGQHSALLLLRGAPTPPCSSITCLRTGTQLQPLTTASPLMAPAPPLSRAPPSPQTHDHSALEHLASTHWLRYTQPQHASKHTATTGRTP